MGDALHPPIFSMYMRMSAGLMRKTGCQSLFGIFVDAIQKGGLDASNALQSEIAVVQSLWRYPVNR